ncbi:baseplate J/gp47 family protein [Methylolobus aquaticus]
MSLTGFKRPPIDQLIRQLEADVAARLPSIDNRLPGTPLYVLTRALAAGLHQLYGYLDWIADQTNVLYCADEALDMYGTIWGITRKQATLASGTATIPGANGSVIPEGAELRTTDTGMIYMTTDPVTVVAGVATLALEASEFGEGGNLAAGVTLALVTPVAGINGRATIVDMSGGSDIEGDTAYRARILARIHQAPHGGAAQDYVTWAMELPGVTRAWCYPNENGPGTVVVRFMMDDGRANGIPEAGDVTDLAAYLEPRRPVCADVSVYAPVAAPVNVTVSALTPDNPEVRASSTAELREMIRREGSPGGTLYQSWFWEAVSQATGCRHHVIAAPAGNVTVAAGQIPVLGTVTFT